jgi:hypothetical protein
MKKGAGRRNKNEVTQSDENKATSSWPLHRERNQEIKEE